MLHDRQDTNMLSYHWENSISDISRTEWEACFPKTDVMKSYDFQHSVERSKLEFVKYHYLIIRSGEEVWAIIPCFEYSYSITDLANKPIRQAVSNMRKYFKNLFYVRMLVAGNPVATCKDMLGINPKFSEALENRDIYQIVFNQVSQYSKDQGIGFIILKELQSGTYNLVKDALPENMTVVESPATTYLYTGEVDGLDYVSQMVSRYRKVFRKRRKNFEESNLRWEKCTDFGQYAEQMHGLYCNVLDKAAVKFETLTPEFFVEINRNLDKNSFAILCFEENRLVAFELILSDDQLHPIYLGMDYDFVDSASLYFNCFYRVVEEAQERQLPYVEFGQTSYEAKVNLGAVVSRLYIGVMHNNPIVNKIIRLFKGHLFPATNIPKPKGVFRNNEKYFDALNSAGVEFERSVLGP